MGLTGLNSLNTMTLFEDAREKCGRCDGYGDWRDRRSDMEFGILPQCYSGPNVRTLAFAHEDQSKGGRESGWHHGRHDSTCMPSVLIIEDDPRIARLLTLELGRHDWGTLWQRTGSDGLKVLASRPIDIVLLDLLLPDMDGLQVLQHIRHQADVPLLILTARDRVIDRVQGLDAGADDYLVKPFAMSELLARVRALTRRVRIAQHMNDDWLSVGNLRISERRHQVLVLDQPVELTAREFALLQYVVQNVGVVVTRDMILERVWGWGYRGSSAVVDVYIGYLRHKIDWKQAELVLSTIRGVGYLVRTIE